MRTPSSLIISFVVLATGLALPTSGLSRRDLASIQGALKQVEDGLNKVNSAFQNFNGADINSATPLLGVSDDLSKTIKSATSTIQASQPLSLQDALGLQQSSGPLIQAAQSVVNTVVTKKPAFDQLGVTSIVVQKIQAQKADSDALGKALVSKVPAIGQGIAQQQIDQISQGLDKAVQQLGGGAAPAAGAGAGAGAGAAIPSNGTAGSVSPPSTPSTSTPAPAAPAAPATPATGGGSTASNPLGGLGALTGLLGGGGNGGAGGLGALTGLLGGGGGAGGGNAAGGLGALTGLLGRRV